MTRLVAVLTRPPADPRSDGALLAAFLTDRDEPAFAELVRRHGPLVWGTCRRALPDPADAEDAFQATFLVLVRRAARLTSAEALGPWLHRVAVWTARALRRKNARRRAVLGALPAGVADPRSSADPTFDLDDLLLGLPERYRSAVVLCHLQGFTHREAADRLGCAEGTVASLVSRALVKLRTKLTGREPAGVLAAVGVVVPSSLSAAAVRSAVAFHLTLPAASPAVAALTEGVLRMFWVKKAASAAAAMVLVAGLGLGLGAYHTRPAAADEPAPGQVRSGPPKAPTVQHLRALERELAAIDRTREDFTLRDQELARRRADIADQIAALKKAGLGRPLLRIAIAEGEGHPITVTEHDADGRAMWAVVPASGPGGGVAALRTYLARARQDKDGPRELTIVCHRNASSRIVQDVAKAARDAGFDSTKVELEWRDGSENIVEPVPKSARQPAPTRTRSLGGDGPPGGEFHEPLAVGETIRIAVHGGRQNDPVPSSPDFLRLTADAEGLIVTGLKPGVARVTVRDTKGRDHTIRIEVTDVPKP